MVDDEDGRASWRREKNLGNGLKREGEETSGSPTPGEGRDVEDREGCERPWDGNAAKGGRVNELLAWRRRHFANTNGHLVMGTWVRGAARGW